MRKFMRPQTGPRLPLIIAGLLLGFFSQAQPTFPVNGITSEKPTSFAFTNATIVTSEKTTLTNASLVIKAGKVVAVGTNLEIPKDAIITDCKGKYIYPSFIDIYSD